jgi:hypothetical protein
VIPLDGAPGRGVVLGSRDAPAVPARRREVVAAQGDAGRGIAAPEELPRRDGVERVLELAPAGEGRGDAARQPEAAGLVVHHLVAPVRQAIDAVDPAVQGEPEVAAEVHGNRLRLRQGLALDIPAPERDLHAHGVPVRRRGLQAKEQGEVPVELLRLARVHALRGRRDEGAKRGERGLAARLQPRQVA